MLLLLALLGGGMALFSRAGGWKQGMFVTLALLKGEYVDPVNVVLDPEGGIRAAGPWLIGGSLFYSLMGTLLTSLLVAVILEWLLRERFGPPRPGRLRRGSRRILLIEGGELAVKVAGALHLERHAVVRVDPRPAPPREAPGVVVFDRAEPALEALEPCRVEADRPALPRPARQSAGSPRPATALAPGKGGDPGPCAGGGGPAGAPARRRYSDLHHGSGRRCGGGDSVR